MALATFQTHICVREAVADMELIEAWEQTGSHRQFAVVQVPGWTMRSELANRCFVVGSCRSAEVNEEVETTVSFLHCASSLPAALHYF